MLVCQNGKIISIHSLRMEGDLSRFSHSSAEIVFQSTPSAWRETASWRQVLDGRNISIHSLRMEGDDNDRRLFIRLIISIHSLRMEGDRRHD